MILRSKNGVCFTEVEERTAAISGICEENGLRD